MQVIHLLCPREQVFPLAQELEAQFEGQADDSVVASGFVEKQPVGFIVITASETFDEDVLAQLHEHPAVTGYSTFSLADDEVFGPFGSELTTLS